MEDRFDGFPFRFLVLYWNHQIIGVIKKQSPTSPPEGTKHLEDKALKVAAQYSGCSQYSMHLH